MNLPFSTNIQALNDWLNSLKLYGNHRASSSLHEVLQALFKQTLDTHTNLLLLNALALPVITYADELENMLLKQPEPTATTIGRKTATLSGNLLRLLCLNYDKISLAQDLSASQHLSSLHAGLHTCGLWQYKQAVFNQCPSKTAWKITAEFFQRAQKYQLLNETVSQTPFNALKQRCIADILQRNILFELCDPYHFKPAIIKKLIIFADNHFHLLNLNTSAQQAHCSWAHRQLKAPTPHIKLAPTKSSNVYVNCHAIADLLHAKNPLNLSLEDLQYLRQYLTGYKGIIDSAIHTTATHTRLIFDYSQIHEHLQHQTAIKNIFKASSKTGIPAQRSSILQLLPLNAPVQSQKRAKAVPAKTFGYSIHPTHIKNYYVTIAAPDLALHCDSPVLLVEPEGKIKLGILRQITSHPVNISQHLLIEHLPGRIDSVQVIVEEEATLGILITKPDNEQEMILPLGKYQPGTKLEL